MMTTKALVPARSLHKRGGNYQKSRALDGVLDRQEPSLNRSRKCRESKVELQSLTIDHFDFSFVTEVLAQKNFSLISWRVLTRRIPGIHPLHWRSC